jgi:polyhydroxyalkanoate synthesis regulator phasin
MKLWNRIKLFISTRRTASNIYAELIALRQANATLEYQKETQSLCYKQHIDNIHNDYKQKISEVTTYKERVNILREEIQKLKDDATKTQKSHEELIKTKNEEYIALMDKHLNLIQFCKENGKIT